MDGQSVQPGGRAPAPGELALVQAFINSHYDLEEVHGAELLASPAALAHWLGRRGLLSPGSHASRSDLRRALELREALRALAARGPSDGALKRLNGAARGARLELQFDETGPRFVSADRAGVGGALGVMLAIVAQAMIAGSWSRLKVCPGEDCGWAFYDHSRNQTGRWCSMSVCGGRAKARTHYHRRRGEQS
jgi:predicted RNA-binding Zn ribbon-like protein